MSTAVSKNLSRIRAQAEQMRSMVATCALDGPIERSAWCAAEHLDHVLKVTNSTLQVLLKPELPVLPAGINIIGRVVILTGWIPRGRGKSPEKLRGTPAAKEALETQLSQLEELLIRVAAEPERNGDPVLRHPFFGNLSFAQSLAFLAIHTNHHLKIIGTRS